MAHNKNYNYSSGAASSVPFAVIEAYKQIRTNILFSLSHNKGKIIAVTSSIPYEGKSTCAVNMAISFSQLGGKILLIDGDLRRPSVYRKLKLKNANGLSSYLGEFCSKEETITHINDNLDVLLSGPIPPNPSELLGSVRMKELLEELSREYDFIIIDTPPINVVTDTMILIQYTDGVVLVARNKVSTHELFQKAVDNIEVTNVKLLGVIINDSSRNIAKYKYKRYKRYQY